jgi:Ser/Thr protein kinase RdoA (MazF antagonist)
LRIPRRAEEIFPVTNSHFVLPSICSVLDPASLVAVVASAFDLGTIHACTFIRYGLNHTYALYTSQGPYILRIYTHGWRTPAEIQYELDLVTFLHQRGLPVAAPVASRDGTYQLAVPAPEGSRQAVVFTYAEGDPRDYANVAAREFGRVVAEMHQALAQFASELPRTPLDMDHLLNEPLARLQPLLTEVPDTWRYLQDLADKVQGQLGAFSAQGLGWQACHGDLHLGNVHFNHQDAPTFFDFDCCAPGWRAYDLAVFRWASYLHGKQEAAWTEFLAGYQAVQALTEAEVQAIPWLVAARHFWLLGLHAADRFHVGRPGPHEINRGIAFLRGWEQTALTV